MGKPHLSNIKLDMGKPHRYIKDDMGMPQSTGRHGRAGAGHPVEAVEAFLAVLCLAVASCA